MLNRCVSQQNSGLFQKITRAVFFKSTRAACFKREFYRPDL